ncbi:TPA: hypothetical protein OLX95_000095 [Clostridioides difficile]|nr:hypothetical protein [Clostridioides difficile]
MSLNKNIKGYEEDKRKFAVIKNGEIESIHHFPFDVIEGFGKTEKELNNTGILFNDINKFEGKITKGKGLKYVYDKNNNCINEVLVDINTTS